MGKMGMKSSGGGGGEIVQVQGGHIVRATGRKDRHSKVYTAKGPRDRRVRLSAHTAIQFYDVQDRLGYDRPSKAVDWLIKKAKSAIDKLAEAPQPSFEADAGLSTDMVVSHHHQEQKQQSSEYNFQISGGGGGDVRTNNQQQTHFSSSLVAPLTNLDPDDAMKSFFPTSTSNASINFQSYHPHDIISRTANPNEDLGLSLHPFQGNVGQAAGSTDHQTLFTGSANALSFNANFPRLSEWNSDLTPQENRSFMVNSQQPSMALLNQQAMFLGHHQGPSPSSLLLSHHQRGTLQSSFSQTFRSWGDHLSVDHQEKTQDHHMDHHHHQQASVFGSQFGSHGIMQGFNIPTRIHGSEGHGIGADRPSSSSSSPPNSNH